MFFFYLQLLIIFISDFLLGVTQSMNVLYQRILIFLEGTPAMGFQSILRFISVVFKVCLSFFLLFILLERTYLFLLSCLCYKILWCLFCSELENDYDFLQWGHHFPTEAVLQCFDISISQTDAKFALGQFSSGPILQLDFCQPQMAKFSMQL